MITSKVENRFRDALFAQEGACNPLALTRSLLDYMEAMRRQPDFTGWDQFTSDPALKLIAHQLAFLFDTPRLDAEFSHYHAVMCTCRDEVKKLGQTAPGVQA